ncbi:MAG: hypothetical protein FJZ95_02445 [Chloroflexi bacterium]|nr:hypothetical protein [Chloroflexota bacterium]
MKKMRSLVVLSIVMIGLLANCIVAPIASANMASFTVSVYDYNQVVGSGDGFDDGRWFEYPQPGQPSWWNQWWYDDPFRPTGKSIDIGFHYEPIDPSKPSSVQVTINWSTPGWVDQPTPPLPGMGYDPEIYIERLTDYGIFWEFTGEGDFTYAGLLPIPYNPEWVSVDVRGYNMSIVGGTLEHICIVPEVATIALVSVGLLSAAGFVWYSRRRAAASIAQ